jgi:hypothetical protein
VENLLWQMNGMDKIRTKPSAQNAIFLQIFLLQRAFWTFVIVASTLKGKHHFSLTLTLVKDFLKGGWQIPK